MELCLATTNVTESQNEKFQDISQKKNSLTFEIGEKRLTVTKNQSGEIFRKAAIDFLLDLLMTHPKLLISSYLVFTLFACVLTLILNSYLTNRTLWAVLFKILKSKHKDGDRREVWSTFGITLRREEKCAPLGSCDKCLRDYQ